MRLISLVSSLHHQGRRIAWPLSLQLQRSSYHVKSYEWGHSVAACRTVDVSTSKQSLQILLDMQTAHPSLYLMLDAYRSHGFKMEKWNPIPASVVKPGQGYGDHYPTPLEITAARERWNQQLSSQDIPMDTVSTVSPAVQHALKQGASLEESLVHIYANTIGVEFQHVEDVDERQWLYTEFEKMQLNALTTPPSPKEVCRQALLMQKSLLFDKFLANKFSTVKRYSGEGAESSLICVDTLLETCATLQSQVPISQVVLGMPHRGRNSLLTVLLEYPVVDYFAKMKGRSEFPKDLRHTGDTFSHFFTSVDLRYEGGKAPLHVSVLPNPSHLEAVVPLIVGKCRSKMQTLAEGDYCGTDSNHSKNGDATLSIQIHGDAAMVGQGIVTETLVMSDVPHFRVGGSVHVTVNNQVGFTTEPHYGRSWRNCTDMAYTIGAPVLHVNAEDAAAVARASRFAVLYRQQFRRDIFINLVCYRRYGHNELDEPSLTQPVMYNFLREKLMPTPLPDRLLAQIGADERKKLDEELAAWNSHLTAALAQVDTYKPQLRTFKAQWQSMQPPKNPSDLGIGLYNTGVPVDRLRELGLASVALPGDFHLHPTLKRAFVEKRTEKLNAAPSEAGLDWATGEALAVASLLNEGHPVRISGQDVGRGTFSHRHWLLVDQKTDEIYAPLNHLPHLQGTSTKPAKVEVANSILSELAVMGFEVGMAMDDPQRLGLWEAQFGDFVNGAQIILDTFLSGTEAKWLYQCGLVLLLPHGYEGAGPEHSSCRLERFLQLTDSMEAPPKGVSEFGLRTGRGTLYLHLSLEMWRVPRPVQFRTLQMPNPLSYVDDDTVNMHVVVPTTPAQYFHVLRRQMKRPFRRPLVVVTPKNLLRHPAATSSLEEMAPGTFFQHVLSTHDVNKTHGEVERVILCSGRHYYTLKQHLDENVKDWTRRIALLRLEQLAPFPLVEVSRVLNTFPKAKHFVWSQEEHRNMGAWNFVESRARNWLGVGLTYAGRRRALAAPAVSIGEVHRKEAEELLQDALNI